MRIAIDGAQSTGKTTLFEQLKRTLDCPYRFIPEPSRAIAEEFGVREATDWPALLQDPEKLARFFEREEDWLRSEEACGDFVLDSSYYLIQAYRYYFLKQDIALSEQSPQYELVLYCPCDNAFEADGFRFSVGRDRVDARYREVLPRLPIRHFVELPLGDCRLDVAQRAIAQYRRTSSD